MADLTCPCHTYMLLTSTEIFSDRCTIQITNYSFNLNYTFITNSLNTMYSDFAYIGFSDEVTNINDYYIMVEFVKIYSIVRDNNDKVNNWQDFVDYYDLSETISKLKCTSLDIIKLVQGTEQCTPIRSEY